MPGQIYAALNRVTNAQGLYLRDTLKKDATTANTEALNEFDRLQKKALSNSASLLIPLPKPLFCSILGLRRLMLST